MEIPNTLAHLSPVPTTGRLYMKYTHKDIIHSRMTEIFKVISASLQQQHPTTSSTWYIEHIYKISTNFSRISHRSVTLGLLVIMLVKNIKYSGKGEKEKSCRGPLEPRLPPPTPHTVTYNLCRWPHLAGSRCLPPPSSPPTTPTPSPTSSPTRPRPPTPP